MTEDEATETVVTRRPIQQRQQSKFRRWVINPVEQATRPPNKKLERSD